ncbi:MAG: hypothetical protein U0L19_10970 [Bacteroidales bacterium]|nr:hypothetical protein [Bacteroidales bacterium]
MAASVKGYAEYEQLAGGIETLFKDSASDLMAYAEQSYKTAQISAADYMETATSFSASLIQGLGGDTKKAADYANRAIISMSDNANKMGTDIENIQNAYQGFAKQNYTMLDNLKLGYGGTKTEMERLIKDAAGMTDEMNKLGISVDASSMSFDNIVNAIAVVQEHLGIAGTSALEAEHTISGSINMMKSSWEDLVTGIANPDADLGKLIDNVLDSILAVMDNLIPAIQTSLKSITKFIQKAIPKLLGVIPGIIKEVLPDIVSAAADLFVVMMNEIPTITQTFIDTFFGVVQMLIPQIPTIFTAVINGILGFLQTLSNPANLQLLLQTALQLLMAIVQAVPQIIQALSVALPEIISNLVAFFLDPNNIMIIMDAAMQLFLGVVQAVPQIFGALFQAFGNLFGKLWEKLQGMFTQFFGNFGETVKRIFVTAVNGVLQFIENFINGPIDTINGFIDIINSTFGSVGVNLGKINRIKLPRMAQGGVVDSATAALIGEAGKEAVIPLERNTENWTAPLAKALAEQFESEGISTAGHITVNMNNYINNNLDADEIGQRLMTSIRRAA